MLWGSFRTYEPVLGAMQLHSRLMLCLATTCFGLGVGFLMGPRLQARHYLATRAIHIYPPWPFATTHSHTGTLDRVRAIPLWAADPRKEAAGSKKTPKPSRKAQEALEEAQRRAYERSLVPRNCTSLAGVDEVGRGPIAGPVFAAACIIPMDVEIPGIKDSKKFSSESQRERVYQLLITHPRVLWSVSYLSSSEVDELNIGQAALQAMDSAVQGLPHAPEYVLVDGNDIPMGLKAQGNAVSVVKGDVQCQSIAAASIIAKVTRDNIMQHYDKQWPQYGFAQHKGYPTAAHIAAVKKYGPCPIHRMSFNPLKDWYR
mmetsp:Transcript_70834/g.124696  ORF Transcript_70834/g.124696 Transcript_70834/m.124696 type:complete len:315 (-) Transcript_70834:284-1228(-)